MPLGECRYRQGQQNLRKYIEHQNIYLVSQALGLKCCALGDFDKELIHKLLDIDGITETAFYALAIGY